MVTYFWSFTILLFFCRFTKPYLGPKTAKYSKKRQRYQEIRMHEVTLPQRPGRTPAVASPVSEQQQNGRTERPQLRLSEAPQQVQPWEVARVDWDNATCEQFLLPCWFTFLLQESSSSPAAAGGYNSKQVTGRIWTKHWYKQTQPSFPAPQRTVVSWPSSTAPRYSITTVTGTPAASLMSLPRARQTPAGPRDSRIASGGSKTHLLGW